MWNVVILSIGVEMGQPIQIGVWLDLHAFRCKYLCSLKQ